MDFQTAPAEQAVPEGADGVTHNPLWMLVPWAVFALAAGVKFWRLTAVFRKRVMDTPSRPDQVRQSLERIWQRDQQAA